MAHTQLNTFHLFAGAGGGILADILLGHNPIGAAEIEQYPRDILLARQRDGILPKFPIWDDVCTLDGRPWRGSVDILCGGFPCQDISAAGKGAGITGARSGLWKEYARLIGEMRPRFVFAENSPLLRTRGLGVILEDLAALGYDARWCVLGAGNVGAPHKRDRMWVLADASGGRCGESESWKIQQSGRAKVIGSSQNVAYANEQRAQVSTFWGHATEQMPGSNSAAGGAFWHTDPAEVCNATGQGLPHRAAETVGECQEVKELERPTCNQANGPVEPLLGRVAHGVANRVDRLKAIGNGQVPQCAAMAWDILSEGLI